jgi:dihydrofolate synthase/folylpolyglutamate synthase
LPLPALRGPHQLDNAGAAIAALRRLGHGEEACGAALTEARWPARMERLTGGALSARFGRGELWLDGGHNPHAAAALAATLDTLHPRPLHLIVGLQGQKDAHGYLAPLLARAASLTAVPVPGARGGAADPASLADIARQAGVAARAAESGEAALALADPAARVLICGSLYLAGDILRAERGGA